ncbi:prolyl oligopeptidase family serine peptidase [Mycobacterium avium subsp. hominissuis]|uniref:extracellular catalytic domain type 1 short-chain-length polyhydroxyalkanoate depolymerase n=1 Tax=Mycobacterium avium TaxID=1764 RepID=UPI001CC6898E|nr:PHB depolymerase family esterase [Mycobacterium avium]MBZ4558849.1 prolyl oligopeptidase family serine peptidase [Mycobacterium avium subsp. hominissuis]MBZ4568685.1 prolyl oligopeptidase family serine peptidase [Mycobacterium avium subsp. hominissuis]MBZ4587761.1 prolyl oligopeptidase family serine peptidase [Mycobacterium avium subsp. hominissuis]MBZ4624424.1 prolyl oligopeptidase family serine peptidase [Mycobacterium avium subsp. hominissuis]
MAYARWLWLAVLAVCVVGCGVRHVSAASARDISGTFRSGGMDRTYMLHVPAGDPVGLVLSLHGGGGTGIAQRGLSGFDAVADAHNLLVVYPDGYEKSWADGRGASPADRHHVDDVAFLVGLVTKLQNDYRVAPGHVFVTGMSNGGFMSNRLACDRADVFAAVAPVAGTLGVGVACNPSRPVSVWAAHGTADPLVPFKGGAVRGRGGLSHAVSAEAMVDKWRKADGCQGDPSMELLPDARDGTVVHRFDSTSCAASTEVVFYRIDKGGHTWPGGKQYLPAAVIGPTTHTLDGSEAIAEFFLAHARD